MPNTNGRPVAGPDAGGAAQKIAAGPLIQDEPILVRRAEAARLLSVSVRKLDEWVAAGLIAKWKLAGVVLFPVEELRRFVRAAASATAPEFRRYLADQAELHEQRSDQYKRTKQRQAAGDGRRPRTPTHPRRNGVDAQSS